MNMSKLIKWSLSTVLAASLTACGGSSGSGTDTTSSNTGTGVEKGLASNDTNIYITSVKTNEDGTLTFTFSDGNTYQTNSLKGEAGKSMSVKNVTTSEDGKLTIAFSDGKSFTTSSLKGEKGTQGIQGDHGLKGDTGAQGDKGDKGDKGDQGIQGEKGDIGATGAKGDTGSQGIQGKKGDTGATGAKGDKGDQGIQGIQGLTGAKGQDGTQGLKGDAGSQGIQGKKGDTGATGAKGDKGDQGNSYGVKSIITNDDGTLTFTFSDEKSFTTKSLKGEDGTTTSVENNSTTTPLTLTKIENNDDTSLTLTFSDNTTHTTKPLKGEKGATGATGEKGEKGEKGAAGIGIQKVSLESNGSLAIIMTDGNITYTASVKGKDGKDGISGTTIGSGGTGSLSVTDVKVDDDGFLTLTFSDKKSFTTEKSLKGPQGDKGNTGLQGKKGNPGDPAIKVVEYDSVGWNKTIPIVNNTSWDVIHTQKSQNIKLENNYNLSGYTIRHYLEVLDAYLVSDIYGSNIVIMKLAENGDFKTIRTLKNNAYSYYNNIVFNSTITPDGNRVFSKYNNTLTIYDWNNSKGKYSDTIKTQDFPSLAQDNSYKSVLKTDYTGTKLIWGKYILKPNEQGIFVYDKTIEQKNKKPIDMGNFLGASPKLDLIWIRNGDRVRIYDKQSDDTWKQSGLIIPKDTQTGEKISYIKHCLISMDKDHSKAILVANAKDKKLKVYTFYKNEKGKWNQSDIQISPDGDSYNLGLYGIMANIDFSKIYVHDNEKEWKIRTYNAKRDNNIVSLLDPFNDNSLIAKLPLDGNITDITSNYASEGDNIEYGDDAKFGKFGKFDGVYSQIKVLDLNLSKEYSLSFWYKDIQYGKVLSWGDNYIELSEDGYIYLNVDNKKYNDSEVSKLENRWTNIVVVVKSGSATLYQNGIKKRSLAISSKNFKGDLTIGSEMEGSIDQVEIFNRALNISEVYRLHEAQE